MSTTLPIYEKHYSAEQYQLAEHIIGLEKAALDKWFKGDITGYKSLWSEKRFTYFDAVVIERVDSHETIKKF